jgi:hypothetical protein
MKSASSALPRLKTLSLWRLSILAFCASFADRIFVIISEFSRNTIGPLEAKEGPRSAMLMKTMTQSAIAPVLRAGTRAAKSPSTEGLRRSSTSARQANDTSLTALVRQVHPSYRWENALWITLGLTSLALLALSFLF